MTKNTFTDLHNSYLSRCSNLIEQKTAWRKLASDYPPDLTACPETRTSLRITREAGDMGLAMLWIIQTAIIRPMFDLYGIYTNRIFKDYMKDEEAAENTFTGALAHSEDKSSPVLLSGNKLTGTKKYITAGENADILLITARTAAESKTDTLLLVPASDITEDELIRLDLKTLLTIDHARFVLSNHRITSDSIISQDAKELRKRVLISSLTERALMTEASIGMLIYLAERISGMGASFSITELEDTLERYKQSTDRIISESLRGERINPDLSCFSVIMKNINTLAGYTDKNMNTIDKELLFRINDILFLSRLLSQGQKK